MKSFTFVVVLFIVAPACAQETPLAAELADIEGQLSEIETQAAHYDGGLILTLIDARRQALLLARTLIKNRINAENGAATVEVTVPAIQPDEARATQIFGEMAAAQHRIEDAEHEAAIRGGLLQVLALTRVETERLTLSQLQMGYLQAKYGISFPVIEPQRAEDTPAKAPVTPLETPEKTAPKALPWADVRFPEIDYALPPFEQAYRDGQRISGWWTIQSTRAAVDDSPKVIALNNSLFRLGNFRDITALVARCVEGETSLVFIQDDFLISGFQRNSFEMTLRVDHKPPQQARWASLTSNQGAGLFGPEAIELIRSIYSAKRLFLRLVESNGQQHDALFDLTGGQDAFDAVAASCGWTPFSLSPDEYRAIQTVLNTEGFDVGAPDGKWGSASQKAIRAYQGSIGLPETGVPDRATLERLGLR